MSWLWRTFWGTKSQKPTKVKKPNHSQKPVGPKAGTSNAKGVDEPVLQDALYGYSGGVQGLRWYACSLIADAEGDVADTFFEETLTGMRQLPEKRHKSREPLKQFEIFGTEQGHVLLTDGSESFKT